MFHENFINSKIPVTVKGSMILFLRNIVVKHLARAPPYDLEIVFFILFFHVSILCRHKKETISKQKWDRYTKLLREINTHAFPHTVALYANKRTGDIKSILRNAWLLTLEFSSSPLHLFCRL